ncbi:E3 ubiquitin-protein ligase DCST1 [Denticeps clupeoides]|uniref:E3 ubiquitin-protein ligase DCST1 n=1 Tax=Denticeps clupeoides TaxID=299321 RepID=UPI0010A31971|nr:E3 ubiquitin-protein ligase DCST1 [Denticeps clupeoides]
MAERERAKRAATPHSTVEKVCRRTLPGFASGYLFGKSPEAFPRARVVLGGVYGALSGAGLFLGLMHNITMSWTQRVIVGCVFVGACILGGALSLFFRCSVLLMFPSMLGSCGRAYIMLFVLYGLYQGPISNIHRNVQDVAFSMGCNIDLQIQHTKVMWRAVVEPYIDILQEIVDETKGLNREARNVSRNFRRVQDEVMGKHGYDPLQEDSATTGNSTQEIFESRTMMRCDYVVQQGVHRCQAWFDDKWQVCMDTIKAPVINHLLCIPMKFGFLCDIMKVMTPWCREKIPVEGNFGQTFDKLNDSIERLGEDFSTNVVLQKTDNQYIYGMKVLQDDFSKELRNAFEEKRVVVEGLVEVVQVLLSCTFLSAFFFAFDYARQYCQDICFDNIYITTYFKQIDQRRKEAGRRYLLPLKKAEQSNFINPFSMSFHPSEKKLLMLSFFQVLSLAVFISVLLAIDWILHHIFDIIHRHTVTEYSFTSRQHVDIKVGGESMLAHLLRKTIGAFNTSSNLDVHSSNRHCLPQPHSLTWEDYLWNTVPLLVMVLMCCLQVYSNRLRRVIAAFYFPKREKRRVLFLYNLHLRRRAEFVSRQCNKLRRERWPRKTLFSMLISPLQRLGLRLQWCAVCGERQGGKQGVKCSLAGCELVYCPQCWRDLGHRCYACSPSEAGHVVDDDHEPEVYYVD